MGTSNIRMTPYGMRKDDDESWIAINGTHVAVNGEGEITKGPGNLKGGATTKKTSGESKSTKSMASASESTKEYGPGTGNGNIPKDAKSVNLRNVGKIDIEASASDKVWGTIYEGKDANGDKVTFSEDGHLLLGDGGINDWQKAVGQEETVVNKTTAKVLSNEESSI